MSKREFLQLAHSFNPKKHSVNGWLMSEKLDGVRAFWDGGISRGLPAAEVPYANTTKDHIRVRTVIATGLWSRYGNVIQAPDWFLDSLPPFQLDGELFMGRKMFQKTTSAVSKLVPIESEWRKVKYLVIDCPPLGTIFADGMQDNINFKKRFVGCEAWALNRVKMLPPSSIHLSFESTNKWLKKNVVSNNCVEVLEQEQLPFMTSLTEERINEKLEQVLEFGGEGVILRRHVSTWVPERTWNCLKFKPFEDAEGTVTGYVWGRETDKGSKLLGMMGALVLKLDNGKRLELSGFRDVERGMQLTDEYDGNDYEDRFEAPGKEVSCAWENPSFPRGLRVTFKYRELTDDGIPKEARYYRNRPVPV